MFYLKFYLKFASSSIKRPYRDREERFSLPHDMYMHMYICI